MADQGPLERVDIGRGVLIKMTRSDAAAWRSSHPIAQSEPPVEEDDVPEQISELADMSLAELRIYASAHDIDLGGARSKADVLARVETPAGESADAE